MRVALLHYVSLSFAFVPGALAGVGADSPAAPATRIVEKVVKTSPEQELTIQLNTGGTLRIRGVDGDAVRLRARLPRKSWRNFVVTLEASAGGVLLHSSAVDGSVPGGGADFELLVPHRYSVSLQSAGGRVDIASLEGTISGRIWGGMITIIHAQGHAEISTTGGAVRVSDSNLSGSITTGGGSVKLVRVTGGLHAAFDPLAHRSPIKPDPQH